MKAGILIALLVVLGAVAATAQPVLRWAPADTTLNPGGQVTLEIRLDEPLAIRTFEFFIDYDSQVLTSLGGGPGSLFDGFNLFSGFQETDPAHPGQVHGYCVILGADDWAVGPGPLFRWTLRGDQAGVADLTAVTVRLLPPGGGEYATATLPATTVTVSGSSPAGLEPGGLPTLAVYPNPFNPRTSIALAGTGSGEGCLEVFDARGRRLARLWQGELEAAGVATWDGRDAAGHPLPSGVYTFLLTGPQGRSRTVRGTLLR